MKRIPLTKGKFALVDDADFKRLAAFKWYEAHGYAARRTGAMDAGRRRAMIYMHREIVKATRVRPVIDHINGNGLDNRRSNLRAATAVQNSENRKAAQSNSKSGILGVALNRKTGKWHVQFKRGGKRIHVGLFATKEKAIAARKKELAKRA